jgi:uncharacterized membrane protein
MDLRLFYSLILTILPFTELRIGLPLAMAFGIDNNVPLIWIFLLIVTLNILVIFFIFYFFDRIHKNLLKFKFYKRSFEKFLIRFQKKVDRFERKYSTAGFVALTFFVAIPLPGTGVWSGSILAWILGLDRKKSILAISLGVLVAGILVFSGTLGFIRFLL